MSKAKAKKTAVKTAAKKNPAPRHSQGGQRRSPSASSQFTRRTDFGNPPNLRTGD